MLCQNAIEGRSSGTHKTFSWWCLDLTRTDSFFWQMKYFFSISFRLPGFPQSLTSDYADPLRYVSKVPISPVGCYLVSYLQRMLQAPRQLCLEALEHRSTTQLDPCGFMPICIHIILCSHAIYVRETLAASHLPRILVIVINAVRQAIV
jgi:hypothetical protein